MALLSCPPLMVCDPCWQLAGGSRGVNARLADVDESGATAAADVVPLLVFDAAVASLLEAANEYDELHPIDRLLVESGVRWTQLRRIVVPSRLKLAEQVLRRAPVAATRPAESPELWCDAVNERMDAQTGTRGGTPATFKYRPKRERWQNIANVFAAAAHRDRRPLTWVTQEEVAAVVGCEDRTVRRAVEWLCDEGLLWEVVPGCQLPEQEVPDGETPAEAADRRTRLLAAIAAEDAAIARARARSRTELDAARAGHLGAAAVAAVYEQLALQGVELDDVVDDDLGSRPDVPLVNITPVYELRLPVEPGVGPAPSRAVRGWLTSKNADPAAESREIVRPPQVFKEDCLKSTSVQPVDNGRASRDPYTEASSQSVVDASETSISRCLPAVEDAAPPALRAPSVAQTQQSQAVQVAEWLLRKTLDVALCDGVSVRWLAAQIRTTRLLDRHGWTQEDLRDLIHGAPQHLHLPRHIRDPRRWIRARLAAADPNLSPSKLRTILTIERGSSFFEQRRTALEEDRVAAERAARRAAIAECHYCDDWGWLEIPGAPVTRCSHDAGGW